MKHLLLIASLVGCATPARPTIKRIPNPQLARFMREMVNVPFSIAVLAIHRPGREARVRQAAIVLQDAVADLVHWQNPPGGSDAARDVFFAYAQNLEHHVVQLSRARDPELAAHSLEAIRQTCNQCHRFFRPANKISADVAIDLHAFDQGGRQ